MPTNTPARSWFAETQPSWRQAEANRALADRTTTVEPECEVYATGAARLIRGVDRTGEFVSLVFHPDEWAAISDAVLGQYGLRLA